MAKFTNVLLSPPSVPPLSSPGLSSPSSSLEVVLRAEAVEMVQAGDKCDFTGTLIVVPDVAQLRTEGQLILALTPSLVHMHMYHPVHLTLNENILAKSLS